MRPTERVRKKDRRNCREKERDTGGAGYISEKVTLKCSVWGGGAWGGLRRRFCRLPLQNIRGDEMQVKSYFIAHEDNLHHTEAI